MREFSPFEIQIYSSYGWKTFTALTEALAQVAQDEDEVNTSRRTMMIRDVRLLLVVTRKLIPDYSCRYGVMMTWWSEKLRGQTSWMCRGDVQLQTA
jgi:hypothetical protein